jgi:hypothetical protein
MFRMTITIPGQPDRLEDFRSAPEAWEWLRNEFRDDWDLALGTPFSALYSAAYRQLSVQDALVEGKYLVGDRIYQIVRVERAKPQPRPQHHNQRRQARLVEDVEHLLKSTRPDKIASRLGYASTENIGVALRRLGRDDLADRFVRINWDPMYAVHQNHKKSPHTAVREPK